MNDQAIEIAQKYEQVIHDLPGHVSSVMFIDEDNFISISTWDTLEHAEAAKGARDAAQRDLLDILAGAPSTNTPNSEHPLPMASHVNCRRSGRSSLRV